MDGISVSKGGTYLFSLAQRSNGKAQTLKIRLTDRTGKILAAGNLITRPGGWQKQEIRLTAMATGSGAQLEIIPALPGTLHLDMVSLFPEKTFRNRRNGLRKDLAETVAAIRPRFIRFPGGCLAHGDGLQNIYRWKNTIGLLEERVPQRNIWGYHQSMGLGYFEYFQFCEDIGAEPLPVVAAGVPC
ncbi:MAG: alpha-L-arabinofuranosidase, partial [Flavihumibacter sp.]